MTLQKLISFQIRLQRLGDVPSRVISKILNDLSDLDLQKITEFRIRHRNLVKRDDCHCSFIWFRPGVYNS